ncbi:MAG: hypothetical protein IID41_06890 [Planctomycetes bacterium]|nr:hypothetical protein [Planctomycetota bacterium]
MLKDRIYRDTGGKLNEADVYPRQSVDSFKPQLTQRRKSKAAKTRNREQRRERRQQEPKLVDGCWTDPQGRPWEADFASEHSPDLLDRRVPKGHRQKKFFHIAGQRSRFVWVTLQSESKALTAERYPDRNKQAEQPKEIDDAPLPLQILADLKDVHLGTLRKLTNKQNRLTKKPNRHPAFDNKPMPSVKESYNWFRNDGTVRMTRTVVKATPRNVDIYLDWYARKHPSTIEFVGRALSTGTKWRADVIADAKKAGFAAVTVDRAYRQLGGHSERSNSAARSAAGKFMKGSARRCARWSLPEPVAAKYREKLAAASNGRQAPLVNPPDDETKSPAAETATAAVVESKPIEPPGKSTLGSNDRALRLAAQRVADCIKNLPGQGSKEIAKQAKIPAGTVRQIILRELTPLGYFTQGKAYFPPRKS